MMNFSNDEITLARRIKNNGLHWEPRAGNYIYDETGFCKQPSPFQWKVYFILNYDYFMKKAGGVNRFKQMMIWLPTWDDARDILKSLSISDQEVVAELKKRQAIEHGTERLALYEMIYKLLKNRATDDCVTSEKGWQTDRHSNV